MFSRRIYETTGLMALAIFLSGQVAFAAAPTGPRLLWGAPNKLGHSTILENSTAAPDEAAIDEKAELGFGFDTIHGNGSPAGYMLTHGNVAKSTVSVSVDGRTMVANQDYFLDTVSGGLSFSKPVESYQIIRVTYRYSAKGSAARSMVGLPLLPHVFGSTSDTNFLHAYRGADAAGGVPFDVLTFGMKMNFGVGSAGLQSMYYVSDPRGNQTASQLFNKAAGSKPVKQVSDTMIVQKATIGGGSTRFNVGYQDIGANFTGFNTLKEQGVLDAAEVAQLQKERGVRRMSASMELKPSNLLPEGSPWNRLGWVRVYDSSGAMDSFTIDYTTPKMGFSAAVRDVDGSFKRLASLSAAELGDMALLTKRQFDPNATAGQVTDADRQAVTREAGLSRNLFSSYIKLTPGLTTTLSLLNIKSDKGGDVSRQTLSLAGSSWQGWVSYQEISDAFDKLSILSPVEAQRFGNERGMRRTAAGMSAKVRGNLSLTGDYALVNGDTGGVSRWNVGLAGKYLNFTTRYQSIDPTFNRTEDLADTQKKAMLGDIGFTRMDVTLGGQLSKALKVDSAWGRATNAAQDLSRSNEVLNMQYAPSDKMRIVLQHSLSQALSGSDIISGAERSVWNIERRFGNNWFVSMGRDLNLTQAGGGVLAGTITSTQHFETDKSAGQWFSYDDRRVDHQTGAFEYARAYNAGLKVSKALSMNVAQTSVDRGTAPSEDVSRITGKWAATSKLSLGFDAYTKSTNFAGDGNGYLATAAGLLAQRFGPLANITLTGEYGASSMSKGSGTFVRGAKLDGQWGKNVWGFEYASLLLANGDRTAARGYRFKTDADPKKWYHIDFYSKQKEAGLTVLEPVRSIAADFRLSPTTQFSYTVNQNKELPNGIIERNSSKSAKLTTRVAKSLNLVFDRRHDQVIAAGTNIIKTNIGIQRQGGKGMVFDLALGLDRAMTPTGCTDGTSIRMKVDRQVNAGQYLTFSGEATIWNNTNITLRGRNTIEARLDYRIPFDF